MLEALRGGLVLAAVGGSFGLTYRLGYINLAHGDLVVLGGLVVWASYEGLGGGLAAISPAVLLVGLLLAAAAAALTNALIHRVVLDPLLKRSLRMPQVLAGLGASLVVSAASGLAFGVSERSLPIPQTLTSIGTSPLRVTDVLLLLGITGGLAIALRGPARLRYRAAADNRALAGLWGVELGRLTLGTAALSGALAGLIGGILVLADGVQSGQSLQMLLLAFAGILLGQSRGALGMVVVPFLIGVVHYAFALWIAPWVSTMAVMLVVAVGLIWKGR